MPTPWSPPCWFRALLEPYFSHSSLGARCHRPLTMTKPFPWVYEGHHSVGRSVIQTAAAPPGPTCCPSLPCPVKVKQELFPGDKGWRQGLGPSLAMGHSGVALGGQLGRGWDGLCGVMGWWRRASGAREERGRVACSWWQRGPHFPALFYPHNISKTRREPGAPGGPHHPAEPGQDLESGSLSRGEVPSVPAHPGE